MNTILILLGLFVAFVATIIGIFLVPFLAWLTGIEYISILMTVFGGLALIISLILFFKHNKHWGIAVVISIPVFISSLITHIRFSSVSSLDNYIESYDGIYNCFGVKIIDENIEIDSRPIIAYNSYGEKFIITWNYDEVKKYISEEPRLDKNGDTVRDYNGSKVFDSCTIYEIDGQIRFYNTSGIMVRKENPYLFSYYENENSHYEHEYQYYGVNADYINKERFVNGKYYPISNVAKAEILDWLEDDYMVQ